ncbi:hypothetical protein SOP89_08800 [Pseudomonas siliginis]|uniref:hypothetical protein n=1 Tax=Pseudomonas siliginis TaxID=2842346 RepID=UPI002B244BD0|nr:hypothetical protein [Pseudomonas siliginis]MEB2651471.1 hypothetical protein [Pseudomonas siliginis]
MKPRKNFKSANTKVESKSSPIAKTESSHTPRIMFPDNGTHSRYFDSEKFLGKGYDDIVYRIFNTIERLLDSAISTGQQTHAYTTLVCYCTGGAIHLFEFCNVLMNSKCFLNLTCSDITEDFIQDFAEFLRQKKIKTQRYIFARVKAILTEREFDINAAWFPSNSFAKRDPNEAPRATCYTPQEHMSLERALSQEVHSILRGSTPLSPEQLAYCLIALADKTGANLQPLLEIDVTAVTEHPFHPQKRILNLYKRRGNKIQPISLTSEEKEKGSDLTEATPFIEKMLNTIISRNDSARKSSTYPFRIFVAPDTPNGAGTGKALTKQAIRGAIKNLVKKHCLQSTDGTPLVVNFERIRKTWVNNIYALTNYDPYSTAALANHGIKVSNDHYLQAPPDSKKKHYFMGEVRVEELLAHRCDKTIIASCSDARNGERAPKDGGLCMQVLGCFSCSNFVVTADDLYRLQSFYLYCLRQREKLGTKAWKKVYGLISRIVTNDILPQFDKKLVENAFVKARETPHPAWNK